MKRVATACVFVGLTVAVDARAAAVDFSSASTATNPDGSIQVLWSTIAESDISEFEIWRSATGIGAMQLIGTKASVGPSSYVFADTAADNGAFEYWIIGVGSAGSAASAIGPVPATTVPSAPMSECSTIANPASCASTGYFDTHCGQLDVRLNLAAGSSWLCEQSFVAYVEAFDAHPNARPGTRFPKPRVTINGQNQVIESAALMDVTDGTRIVDDPSNYRDLRQFMSRQDFVANPLPPLESIAYAANGTDIESCAEYGFLATDDYSRWREHVEHTPKTSLERIGDLFNGSHAFVSFQSGNWINTAKDSDAVVIGDHVVRTIEPSYDHRLFLTQVFASPFEAWDRTQGRPRIAPVMTSENWNFHHAAYNTALQNNWSAEELDELWSISGEYLGLIARYSFLEIEKIRTLLEDDLRFGAPSMKDAWKHVNTRIRNANLSENVNALTCRWDRFAALTILPSQAGHPNGIFASDHLGVLESPGPSIDPIAQDVVFGTRGWRFGTSLDPMSDQPGAPNPPPERPAVLGDEDYLSPPDGEECGSGDPVDPLLEPLINASQLSFYDPYFSWRAQQMGLLQASLIGQINELYDRLAILCQPAEKCAWSPEMLLGRLERHYAAYRQRLELRCQMMTGDDLTNLSRLFDIMPLSALTIEGATEVQAMQSVAYADNVSNLHQLWQNVQDYRALLYRENTLRVRHLARRMYQYLPKDGDNRARLARQNGRVQTRASDLYFVASQQQSEGGLDCEITTEQIEAVANDPTLAPELICQCGVKQITDSTIRTAIMQELSDTEMFRYFLDADGSTSNYRFIGFAGEEIGTTPVDDTVTFELRYNDSIAQALKTLLHLNRHLSWMVFAGPVPLSVNGSAAGVLGARVGWDINPLTTDVCSTTETAEILNLDIRVYAGLDTFARVAAGIPGLAAAGVEGRLRVFDLGVRQTDNYRVGLADDFVGPQETFTEFVDRLGCFAGPLAAGDPLVDACPQLVQDICDGQLAIVDKLLQIENRVDWFFGLASLGGSLSVYVELLFKRFSVELFSWRSLALDAHVSSDDPVADYELFTSRAAAEESMGILPEVIVDILSWPFQRENNPGLGDAPFCPESP